MSDDLPLQIRRTQLSVDYKAHLESPFMDAIYALAEERKREIDERLHMHAVHGKLDAADNLLGVELKLMEDILSGDFFDRAYRRADAKIRGGAEARARAAALYDKAVSP